MSCADCKTTTPEPIEVGDEEDGVHQAYWFMVEGNSPVHAHGIEADGDLALRFAVWPYLEAPDPEPGQEILCPLCFDKRYPIEDEDPTDVDPWIPTP